MMVKTFWKMYRRKIGMGCILLGIGLLYYILTQFTSFRIPCLFYQITGLACPGCGISRFCIALLKGNLPGAIRENLAVALLLPIWLLFYLIRLLFHPVCMAKNSRGERILLWGSIFILLLFGVLRNLPGLEFLLPSV